MKVLLVLCCVFGFSNLLIAQESFSPEEAIVGGVRDYSNLHPYVFNLGHCSAFLISPKVLVSSAHCITSEIKPRRRLRLSNSYSGGLRFGGRIANVLVHPLYHSAKYQDIAVIIMKENLKTKFSVSHIPSLFYGDEFSWKKYLADKPILTAIGYGKDRRGKSGRKNMVNLAFKKFFFDIKENDIDLLQEWTLSQFHKDSVLPTAFTLSNKGEDTCNGDSGGPVVEQGLEGKLVVGLTMGGSPRCGSGKSPSAYRLLFPDLCWFKTELKAHLGKEIIQYCQ